MPKMSTTTPVNHGGWRAAAVRHVGSSSVASSEMPIPAEQDNIALRNTENSHSSSVDTSTHGCQSANSSDICYAPNSHAARRRSTGIETTSSALSDRLVSRHMERTPQLIRTNTGVTACSNRPQVIGSAPVGATISSNYHFGSASKTGYAASVDSQGGKRSNLLSSVHTSAASPTAGSNADEDMRDTDVINVMQSDGHERLSEDEQGKVHARYTLHLNNFLSSLRFS